MVKCKKCGAVLSSNALFCDVCGTRQQKEKKCESCGFILNFTSQVDFAFCPVCGKSLAKKTSADKKKLDSVKLEQRILGMHEAFEFVDSKEESDLSELLLSAVDDGNVQIAEALLEAGADIDATDSDDNTPLMKACEHGDNKMVACLLQYEPDLDAENYNGETARDLAKEGGYKYIVGLLNKYEQENDD